jgi:hypothetical protein
MIEDSHKRNRAKSELLHFFDENKSSSEAKKNDLRACYPKNRPHI